MSVNCTNALFAFACDQAYFPLLKGLVASLAEPGGLPTCATFALIDLGCDPAALEWLTGHGVVIVPADTLPIGALASPALGYHRAQTCRPFLPWIFPDHDVLGWIDSDAWFQDRGIIDILVEEAIRTPHAILISPELHYTYTNIDQDPATAQGAQFFYYNELYGQDAATALFRFPVLNSGFFAMHREMPLWQAWQAEVTDIYVAQFDGLTPGARHFGEQLSLNKLIRAGAVARYFDPLFNYLCLWNMPFRDAQDVVRVALPPHAPVGMIHLAGGWRHFGRKYFDAGLLYRHGAYLSDAEALLLLQRPDGEAVR